MQNHTRAFATFAKRNGHKGAVALLLSLLASSCGARTDLGVPDTTDEACTLEPLTTTLTIPSTSAWFDTGIDVTAGQFLQIKATGKVHYGTKPEQVTDANGGHYSGKKFFETAVFPGTIVCSLIGKVGGSTELDTGAALPEGKPKSGPGFVGTFYEELVPQSGRLFLGFNDQKHTFGDNDGLFTVTITLSC